MYRLFESIRIRDGVPQHLYWHQYRFEQAFRNMYGALPGYRIEEVLTVPPDLKSGLVKARFSYHISGFQFEYDVYSPQRIRSLAMVWDDDIDYSLKYCNRKPLERLYAQRKDCDDILIVKNGCITDSSIANIVFCDGSNWITPATPLLRGVYRERLLAERRISEALLRPEDIAAFRGWKLINAMRYLEEQEAIPVSSIYWSRRSALP